MTTTQRSKTSDASEAAFARAVRDGVVGLFRGDTKVVDAEVDDILNAVDEQAWRLTLVLTPPTGDGWDLETTGLLKERGRALLDELAQQTGQALDGWTVVRVTARPEDVDVSDVAEDVDVADGADGLREERTVGPDLL